MFETPQRIEENLELVKKALQRLVITTDKETITTAMKSRILSSEPNARTTLIGEADRSLSSDLVSATNLLMAAGVSFSEATNVALVGKYAFLAISCLEIENPNSLDTIETFGTTAEELTAIIDWCAGVFSDAQATAIRMDSNNDVYQNFKSLAKDGEAFSTFAYGSDAQAFDSIAGNFRSGDRLVWQAPVDSSVYSYRSDVAQILNKLVAIILSATSDKETQRDILATQKSAKATDQYLTDAVKPDPLQRRALAKSGKVLTDVVTRLFPGCAIEADQEEVLNTMLELSKLTVEWYLQRDPAVMAKLSALHSLHVSLVTQSMIEFLVQATSQVKINDHDAKTGNYTLHESGKDIVLASMEPLLVESLITLAEDMDVELTSPLPINDPNDYAPIFMLEKKMIKDLALKALAGETIDLYAAFPHSDLSDTQDLEALLWSTNIMHELVKELLRSKGKKWYTPKVLTAISHKALALSYELLPALAQVFTVDEITAVIRNGIGNLKIEDLLEPIES